MPLGCKTYSDVSIVVPPFAADAEQFGLLFMPCMHAVCGAVSASRKRVDSHVDEENCAGTELKEMKH
jgi:hypothetical protein